MKNLLLFVNIVSIAVVTSSSYLRCRDEVTGEALDWFTLYKMPKMSDQKKANSKLLQEGTAYMYMTNSQQEKWRYSSISMNDSTSIAAKTLEPLYNNNNSTIGYILYNDQADKVSVTRGHTKGVLMFDESSIVWLIHSIPHFPPMRSQKQYYIKGSQCVYGQSMLCLSMKIENLEAISKQFMFNYPQIYDYFIPDTLRNSNTLETLMQVLDGKHVKTEPWSNVELLQTWSGEKMLYFAKYTNFQDDLYSGLVAPHLNSSLFTETWSNGIGTLSSNCSLDFKYHVMNVENIKFVDYDGIQFSVHHDHSKIALTDHTESNVKVTCIGDINRQAEQFKRGGGTVCFMQNEKVWTAYRSIVDSVQSCEKKNIILSKISNIRFGNYVVAKAKTMYNFVKNKVFCSFSQNC
jgi:deoxyribonuclease-2